MASKRLLVALALAGIVGPLCFITLVIIQARLNPSYSHIRMPISALAAWPIGWVQSINFYVLATLLAGLILGLHLVLRPTRYGWVGIILMWMGTLGLVLAGIFPWIMVNGQPTETPAHVVGAITCFLCTSIGIIVLSRRIAADPEWNHLGNYVLVTGIAMLILFVVLGAFAVDDGTPLHPWAGLIQRVLVAIWVMCIFVLAARLWRIARRPRVSV
jgi:hypothetical membrane protein